MSHLTQIAIELDDLNAIKEALVEMGYEVREGKHRLSAFDWNMEADLSVQKNGRQLNIGFMQKEDGVIDIKADFWNTGVNQKNFREQLQQLHAKHKTISIIRKKGWKVGNATTLEDGSIKLTATRWS